MAGRQGGDMGLRWGDEERRLVFQYLEDGRLDPKRMNSAVYLRSIKTLEPCWDKHANRNFYQNVRRQVAAWQSSQHRAGGRRGDADNDEAEEAEESEGEEESDEPEEEPQHRRRHQSAPLRECLFSAKLSFLC